MPECSVLVLGLVRKLVVESVLGIKASYFEQELSFQEIEFEIFLEA